MDTEMDPNANQKVSCIANYLYEASETDELSLRPGDVVKEVERLAGGWWRGELRGKRGMFPDNFVSVIDQANARSGGVQGRCRAVFSYQPANADELALCVGDVLEVLAEVEEGWWQGRRQGRVGVFPSNFVVMLDAPAAAPTFEPAPALPPKPVKELCRVLFPYTAVNEDEITLSEGDIVTIVSKDAPDRGWWRGELNGRVGLFPDNFVQLLPPVTQDVEEKRPDRPPAAKSAAPLYPVLNKFSEKVTSVKELTTSKISSHKENTISKESSATSQVIHSSKSETVIDGVDGQIKKPPVPTKKSPTPSAVGGLFSGLKSKMLSSASSDKEKSPPAPAGAEWDRPDGGAASRPAEAAGTLDLERNCILNDPRAQRVKAPRRRPPGQALRDDAPPAPAPAPAPSPSPTPAPAPATATSAPLIPLSNGHDAAHEAAERSSTLEKSEEIKPKAREWEKHRAPWMAELKLNQAKKTSFGDSKGAKSNSGSTDRLLECGLEEKRSTHSMEMSKSTSSISSRISVLESFEEQTTTKVRHSLDSAPTAGSGVGAGSGAEAEAAAPRTVSMHSPTAAGRTFSTMLDDLKKPSAPSAPAALVRTDLDPEKQRKQTTAKFIEVHSASVERTDVAHELRERKYSAGEKMERNGELESLERRPSESEGTLVDKLNSRITNLEKLLEVQNAKFSAALEELARRLAAETERRLALRAELDKLATCVTQV